MKIIYSLKTGFQRSVRSWKAALIITLALLFLISFFIIPFNGVLKSSFGSSAVADELVENLNFDIITDLSNIMKDFGSFFSSGILLLITAGIIVLTFFSGGLFNSLKCEQGRFSVAQFFRASAEYFWPFLGISVIVGLLIGFISVFLTGIIMGIMLAGDPVSNSVTRIISIVSVIILIVVTSVFFLVADYSRAHYSAGKKPKIFNSVGYGFKMTFGSFSSSVPMMFILTIVQIMFVWMMSRLFFIWKPSTGPALFLMFLASQFMFFMRILLRSWRYASVTSMMEILEKKAGGVAGIRENETLINEKYPLI
jgi:hypothetical protein